MRDLVIDMEIINKLVAGNNLPDKLRTEYFLLKEKQRRTISNPKIKLTKKEQEKLETLVKMDNYLE